MCVVTDWSVVDEVIVCACMHTYTHTHTQMYTHTPGRAHILVIQNPEKTGQVTRHRAHRKQG